MSEQPPVRGDSRPRRRRAWLIIVLAVGLVGGYFLFPRWNRDELAWAIGRAKHRMMGPKTPAQWEAPGLSMVERLERVARFEDPPRRHFPTIKYEAIRSIPIFANTPRFRFFHARGLMEVGELTAAIDLLRGLQSEAERGSEAWTRVTMYLAVAHLRFGEVENCLVGHNAESCYLPIRKGGVHSRPEGSRGAIEEFARLLEENPQNIEAAWLLNIAYMTLGEYPDGVPESFRLPLEALDSGAAPRVFPDVAGALGVDDQTTAGGVILEDLTGDGLLDIVSSGQALREQLRLFVNQGDGTFVDATEEFGLMGQVGGINISHTDYNNDGFADILVLRGAWRERRGRHPNSLLRNDGGRGFTDVTEDAGLLSYIPTQVGVWGDYDHDGWIDLFVGNEGRGGTPDPPQLFRNNGDGTFTDVAAAVGLGQPGFIKGAAWGDIDNDGLVDLYVSLFRGSNRLYRNLGGDESGWSFDEVGEALGVSGPTAGSFVPWFFDFNNDGWEDLFVGSYQSRLSEVVTHYYGGQADERSWSRLFLNDGQGGFVDVTSEVGLDLSLMVMGANYGDIDNDGFLDAYFGTGAPPFANLVPNRMFRSVEGAQFEEVTTAGALGHLQKGHGIAFGDLDNDGDQDIFAQMGGYLQSDIYHNALFENPGHENRWLTLRLRGNDSNRSAMGARLRLRVLTADGERQIHRTVGTGGSFGSSSLQAEIGLGQAERVLDIEIRWPSGLVQRISDPGMDRFLEIEEGNPTVRQVDLPEFRFHAGGHAQH